MKNEKLLERLEQIYKIFEEGMVGEFDGFEGTKDQPDARLIESMIVLEELIDDLKEEQ